MYTANLIFYSPLLPKHNKICQPRIFRDKAWTGWGAGGIIQNISRAVSTAH